MIRWFAAHPTAANLLLLLILAIGALAAPGLVRETFPDFRPVEAEVSVVYRGAGAAEVEDAICRRLWTGVQRLDDLETFTCTAQDNAARAVAEMRASGDASRFLEDLRAEIAAIGDLPDRSDPPVVRPLHRTDFLAALAIAGDMAPVHLERYAADLRDRLRAVPGVADVTLSGFGDRQFRIEVSHAVLRQHGLSMADLADLIAAQSADLPAGTLETPGRDIRLRVTDERRSLAELAAVTVIAAPGGTELTLGDIATLSEDFATPENRVLLDGRRAAVLDLYKSSNADALTVLDRVQDLLALERAVQPSTLRLEIVQDMTSIIRDRLSMLLRNGAIGLVLVVAAMSLFFRPRFAVWAAVALPVSFIGAFVAMALLGLTINMMTLVALLMAIGIVMDDSIVISDSIAERAAAGAEPLQAAIDGTRRVMPGVISSFLTTAAVFAPLSFLAGQLGAVLQVLPIVLLAAIAASLIEAFWILPHHLKGSLANPPPPAPWRQRFERGMEHVRENIVGRAADGAVRYRYRVAGAMLIAMLGTIGYMGGGYIGREAIPEIEGDALEARLLLPQGTPLAGTQAVVAQITAALERVDERLTPRQPGGASLVRTVQVRFGRNADAGESGPHVATVIADFLGVETRRTTLEELIALWRQELGDMPGVIALTLQEPGLGPQGVAIEYTLSGPDLTALASAADALMAELATYRGTYNSLHDLRPGRPELRLSLAPGARDLGLTAVDVSRQLRAAFLGTTVATVQIGALAHDIELVGPVADRDGRDRLMAFTIALPNGDAVPLATIADIQEGRGWSQIAHINGQRTVTVQASVDVRAGNTQAITRAVDTAGLPTILAAHAGVTAAIGGQSAAFAETSGSILRGFLIGLVGIFVVLSYQFRSYLEPVIVMLTIPLAFFGAVWGHVLMGYDISLPSLVGGASLAGIVVNNSILLVQFIKGHVADGMDVMRAAGQASRDRCRAIILSATTTILGIFPLLMETSSQAQVLKPLVISVSFGLASATVLVLILLPALYAILNDLRDRR